MRLDINPNSGVPIFVQIKEQIKNAIAGGVLEEGEKLPSVRELSKELTVNPNTVSKAYQELMNEGIIVKERGIGMFVSIQSKTIDDKRNEELFKEKLEMLFTEAYHLNIPEGKIKEMFFEELERWKYRLNERGKNK